MMNNSSTADRAAAIQESIRCILYEDWDPIGVKGDAPPTEYNSYIGGVYRILASTRSESDLIDFLTKAATVTMGLDQPLPENLKKIEEWHKLVVRKLLALDVTLHGRH